MHIYARNILLCMKLFWDELEMIKTGETMDKLRDFIEKKKKRGQERKPRYGTRKLSIGLVSCMLGYFLIFSPSQAMAAEETSENQIQLEQEVEKPPVDTSDQVQEEVEEIQEVEQVEEVEQVQNLEEDEKESFKLKEEQIIKLKEAGFTDEEIEYLRIAIDLELSLNPNFNVDQYLDDEIAKKNPDAELSNKEEDPRLMSASNKEVKKDQEKEVKEDLEKEVEEDLESEDKKDLEEDKEDLEKDGLKDEPSDEKLMASSLSEEEKLEVSPVNEDLLRVVK